MIKKTCILLSLFLSAGIYAQKSGKLIGNVIGTEICYDNQTNQASTSVNTPQNAFDGDFNTFFSAYQTSGGWTGLDLGEKFVITKIAFCPRQGWNRQAVLGVFEGANKPDFTDAIPLHIISAATDYDKMTEQVIDCSRGFRYVRYLGPANSRSNIAELEFHGYKSEGDDSKLHQLTNLPTVYIHTENAEDVVIKTKYLKGMVSVISEGGTKIYTDSLDIKGRGNYSWTFPKKPYRMKLYNKTNLLDLPSKAKNWTLISNYGDKTLVRNLLAFDLSKRFDMAYTPAGVLVDVFLNGEYKGCYQLCDKIEVEQGRVEIEEMKKKDIELPNLSGGYLIELDRYAPDEDSWFTSAIKNVPVTIQYPKDDKIVPEQSNYIKGHFDKFEAALFADNYTDPVEGYRKYLDVPTFIRHFLIGEISGNTDTYWSVYMYKKRSDDRFYVGPVWDFDIAYENDYRTYPISDNPDWISTTTGSAATGVRDLLNSLLTDSSFTKEVRDIYAEYRDSKVLSEKSLLKVLDDYAIEAEEAQKLNFARWDIMNTIVHGNPAIFGSYEAEVGNVRDYITNRIKWMDKKLSYTPVSVIETPSVPMFSVYSSNKQLLINGVAETLNIAVYDVSGKIIFSKTINDDFSIPLSSGIYIVKATSESAGVKTVKSVVK